MNHSDALPRSTAGTDVEWERKDSNTELPCAIIYLQWKWAAKCFVSSGRRRSAAKAAQCAAEIVI
jgi:hypothetical protein